MCIAASDNPVIRRVMVGDAVVVSEANVDRGSVVLIGRARVVVDLEGIVRNEQWGLDGWMWSVSEFLHRINTFVSAVMSSEAWMDVSCQWSMIECPTQYQYRNPMFVSTVLRGYNTIHAYSSMRARERKRYI
jgi:hypothetical protein